MPKVMNISPTQHSVNLDSKNAQGIRESLHIKPRAIIELSDAQFNSRELRKLLDAKILVNVTANEARRAQREKEMRGE